MIYLIEALVTEPDGSKSPLMNNPYVKIAYNSDDPDVQAHMDDLTKTGFRVLSVKSRPAAMSEIFSPDLDAETKDRQGNMKIVDGKRVYVEDESSDRAK